MKTRQPKQYYRYIITLDTERWPRKLVEELTDESRLMADHLVSVTDLQTDQHIYGATYRVGRSLQEQALPQYQYVWKDARK